MKVQFGKKVRCIPLPPRRADQNEHIDITETPPKFGGVELPSEIREAIEQERSAEEPIAVPKSPNPHPIVQAWGPAKQPSFGPPSFTPAAEARRRRIATVFFREIEKRGGKIVQDGLDLIVTMFGQRFEITLREKLKQMHVPLSDSDRRLGWNVDRGYNTELRPSGLLQFRIDTYITGVQREWTESESKPLEGRIRVIIIGLYLVAAALKSQAEERAERERQWLIQEKRRLEVEEQRRKERERVKVLIDEANAWEKANRVRLYITARKSILRDASTTDEWVEWANRVAESIDPLTSASAHGPSPLEED